MDIKKPWMAIGDFNEVTGAHETSSPDSFNVRRCKGFNSWIFDEGLIDPGFEGGLYTWTRGKEEGSFQGARLDRALVSPDFLEIFSNLVIKHVPAVNSNHSPLLVEFRRNDMEGHDGFKFQVARLTHKEFDNLIKANWDKKEDAMQNVDSLKGVLQNWNREVFGNIHARKNILLARLRGISRRKTMVCSNGLLKLEKKLKKELDETLY